MKTSAELLSVAKAMEQRSAERYRELAEAFEASCNNPETAQAFAELAEIEEKHAAEFPASVGPGPETVPWGEDDPEIADPDAVHYLMWPWHAFDLALRHEWETEALFLSLSQHSPFADVRDEAVRLVERERDHARQMQAKRDDLPMPPDDWDDDEDGPNWEAGD